MPPGASNSRENRFALLAYDSPPRKKKSNNKATPYDFFPELPNTVVANPKYLVLSSTETNKSMADFSCFAVYRSIQLISKDIISISELRDGNLLLLVKDVKTADKFLKSKSLLGVCNIKCTLHENLNTSKGTIYAPYLNKVADEEIVNELKSQGVISAYKFNKFFEGKPVPSGVILLSFDAYNLPTKIDISWHSVKVKEYIPNPMRCKSCQLLGHTAKWCKNSPMCVSCYLPPHTPADCTRLLCANCSENHAASSKDCKKFIQQKEILTIKIKNKCSMPQARQIHRNQLSNSPVLLNNSYANVASNSKENIPSLSTNNNVNQNTVNSTTIKSKSNAEKNTISQTQSSISVSPASTSNQNNNQVKKIINKPTTNTITPSLSTSESNLRKNLSLPSNNNNNNFSSNSLVYSPPRTRKSAKKQLSHSSSNNSLDLSFKEIESMNDSSSNIKPFHSSTSLLFNDKSIDYQDEVL